MFSMHHSSYDDEIINQCVGSVMFCLAWVIIIAYIAKYVGMGVMGIMVIIGSCFITHHHTALDKLYRLKKMVNEAIRFP